MSNRFIPHVRVDQDEVLLTRTSYTFKAAIEPPCSNHSVVCQEIVQTREDRLAEVDNARCNNPTGM